MYNVIIITLTLLLISCGQEKANKRTVDWESFSARKSLYAELIGDKVAHGCDSLLFTALSNNANIEQFRNSDGQWFRTPSHNCYSEGKSKSTISRDMLLGVLWYSKQNKRLDLLEDLWEYGSERSWIMGDGLRNRVVLSPVFISTLAGLIKLLGGTDHTLFRTLPAFWTKGLKDFEAHLQVIHILIRRDLEVNDIGGEGVIQHHAERQPFNPLFQAANGNIIKAVNLLLNPKWWPNDRLPVSEDRCEAWIIQRDFGSDWEPCKEGKQHTGGDFLFVSDIILGAR